MVKMMRNGITEAHIEFQQLITAMVFKILELDQSNHALPHIESSISD